MGDKFRKHFTFNLGVIAGSVIVVIIGVYALAYYVRVTSAKIEASRGIIRERLATIGNLAELKNSLSEAREYEERITALFPSRDELLRFPRFLDDLARTYGVQLSFSFEGEPSLSTESVLGQAGFALRLTGSFSQVVRLLGDLEQRTTKFMVHIDQMEIVSVEADEYRVDVRGRVFFK